MLQLQLQYNFDEDSFSKAFAQFENKMGLGLGWLRAVAQGDIYSYSKIGLGSNFQNNSNSC